MDRARLAQEIKAACRIAPAQPWDAIKEALEDREPTDELFWRDSGLLGWDVFPLLQALLENIDTIITTLEET